MVWYKTWHIQIVSLHFLKQTILLEYMDVSNLNFSFGLHCSYVLGSGLFCKPLCSLNIWTPHKYWIFTFQTLVCYFFTMYLVFPMVFLFVIFNFMDSKKSCYDPCVTHAHTTVSLISSSIFLVVFLH